MLLENNNRIAVQFTSDIRGVLMTSLLKQAPAPPQDSTLNPEIQASGRNAPYLGSAKNKADKARWQRNWRNTHTAEVRAIWKRWEQATGYIKNGAQHRKRTFGLTKERYEQLLSVQCGLCVICQLPPTDINPLVPDHNHACCSGRKSCGKCIRGLLHRTCNSAIGLFGDDPVLLKRAAEYLEKTNAVEITSAA